MHYLTIVTRIFLRSKLYSLIALFGLTLGLTISFITSLLMWQEVNYDSHVPEVERLYLVQNKLDRPGRESLMLNSAMAPLAEAMEEALPGVEQTARLWRQWTPYTRKDNSIFNQLTYYVDASFLDLFPVDLIEGSVEATFAEPQTLMISRTRAEALFGDAPAVGEILYTNNNEIALKVTAVFEDWPATSHLEIDMISPINAPQIYTNAMRKNSWQNTNIVTYVKIAEGMSAAAMEPALQQLVSTRAEMASNGSLDRSLEASLIPVSDVHLYGGPYYFPLKPKGDLNQLMATFAVGILVMLIACFNHINLSTAQALKRAREVAVRKVVGASKKQLVVQFLSEAALYCGAAWLIALALTEIVLPYAHTLLGTELVADMLWQPSVILIQFAIVATVTLCAGFYPALYLSGFTPQRILKSEVGTGKGSRSSLRATLVVMQFAISIGLIVSTIIIFAQVKYTQDFDLGFEQENLVVLHGVRRSPQGTIQLSRSLDAALTGREGILGVSGSSALPSWDSRDETRIRLEGQGEESYETLLRLGVDLDFLSTYKIPVIAGRAFSEEYALDRIQWDWEARKGTELPVIINETAVSLLGFDRAEDAVGAATIIEMGAGQPRVSRIVGVSSDFHFLSLKSKLAPMVLLPDPSLFNAMTVRIDPANVDVALKSIEEGWATVIKDQAVSRGYVDDELVTQYEAEAHQLRVIGAMALLAIIIALLGLYGLATFMMEQRAREVGIRKVLGAKVKDIVYLMVWQFSKPVLVANLIAWPLVWYLGSLWLQGFAYRIDMSLPPFVVAALTAVAAAWLVVGGHAWRIATNSPIRALRHE